MNARLVGRMGHQPPQGIHFLNQMPLADAANGRVAAHGAQGVDIVGQQQGARAHARRRQGRFGARVTAADDDDLVGLGVKHIAILPFLGCYWPGNPIGYGVFMPLAPALSPRGEGVF